MADASTAAAIFIVPPFVWFIYLPSFQISVASFQSFPIFSQTTTYLPVTSLGSGPLVFRLYIPISRAAEGPSGLTSSVVSFGSLTCSAVLFHIDPIASRPRTIAAPGGSAVASSAYNDAIPAKSPLLKKSPCKTQSAEKHLL